MHTPSVFESSLAIVPMFSTTGWLCRRCASETRSCLWCAVTGIVVSGAPPPPNGMAGAARWDAISLPSLHHSSSMQAGLSVPLPPMPLSAPNMEETSGVASGVGHREGRR